MMEDVLDKVQVRRYEAYKDSGVEWLGEIPGHWGLLKFKHLFFEKNERSTDGSEDLLSVSQYTGVTLKKDKLDGDDLLTTAETLEGYKKVAVNDLVINIMLAWNGSLGFSPYIGITSPAYCVYRLKNISGNFKYLHYLLRTDIYKAEFKRNSSGVIESRLRLYTHDFFRIISVLPPFNEQEAIANFLDKKTAQIEKAISIKEKQIELLKELRQILIHNAVTRGLNTDAAMKDSGVEWIGEIPAHWEVKKLKYVAQIQNGQIDPTDKLYLDQILIAPNHIESSTGRILAKETAKDQNAESGKYQVTKGNVIYSKIRPELRKACIAEEDCLCSADMYPLKLDKNICGLFMRHILLGEVFSMQMVERSLRVAMPKVNREDVLNYAIAFPSIDEQNEIVQFLQKLDANIHRNQSVVLAQIKKLKEYKATLINAAVTGKIKVC